MDPMLKQLYEALKKQSQEAATPTHDVVRTTTIEAMRKSDKEDVHLSKPLADLAESIDWLNPSLSWKGVRRMAIENYRKLGEAHSSTALAQLLRAGIQTIANNWYERTPVNWPEYIQEVSSDKRQEFYAPLYGSALPKRTGRGVPYDEQRIKGVDREIINYKVMGGESFERELFDDDQTGQIAQRANNLGEAMRVYEEVYAAARILGTAQTISNVVVPASTYATVNANGTAITTPFSVNLYETGSGNRPAAFAQLSFPNIKTGFEKLLDAKDPLGVKISVTPDTLLVSSFDYVNIRTFLNSAYYPAVPGLGGENAGSASSGVAGGAFSENAIKGLMNPALNRYLPNGAWYLGQARKGMLFQRRDPLEVVQEQPQSGESFSRDVYRFRSRSRFELEWIDSRFWYCGNDGTAAVVQ